ncbi:hypothetical protein V6V47_24070 [Micromonospora sp. CPCC 205539]|uniref:hypothetical protein n=1 Tax=Micromonospora sp. CPCC 205539 TaxID=3122408 RepID=UPI002FF109A0
MSVRVRWRQTLLLLRPLVRAVPWGPPAVAAVLSGLAVLPALLDDPAPGVGLWGLRAAAMLFGAAASFALVDRMAPLTIVPTPRWLRQWLRLIVILVPAAIGWLALYAMVRGAVGGAALGSAGDVVVEAAVCGLTGLAGAAVAARHRHTSTAALAGPGTQATVVAASLFLSGRYSPWPVPGEPNWALVHRYWLAVLPVIVVVLLLANRDTWPLRSGRTASPVP